MHKITYLPIARRDLNEIMFYIAHRLHAPKAARDLLDKLDIAISNTAQFLYMYKVYRPIQTLQQEYRVIPVENYAVFYVVTEDIIEIRRVVYAKKDLSKINLE